MPGSNYQFPSIQDFVERLIPVQQTVTNHLGIDGVKNITVCSAFQRGTNEVGVWPAKMKQDLIESIVGGMPIGGFTLVKPYIGSANCRVWSILDGANRARVIRDFLEGKFTIPCSVDSEDGDGVVHKKFDELDIETQTKFKLRHIMIEEVTINRQDPHNIVAKMFTNLNTKVKPLSLGELLKAHGWQNNIPYIELAKHLLGKPWVTDDSETTKVYKNKAQEIQNLRVKWHSTFPGKGKDNIRSHPRCGNLALMCSYILSSVRKSIYYLDKGKNFNKMSKFLKEETTIDEDSMDKLINHFNKLLDIIRQVNNYSKAFKSTYGFPSNKGIFSIWNAIVNDDMDDNYRDKTVRFYNQLHIENTEKKGELYENWKKVWDGDCHLTEKKAFHINEIINSM